MPFFDPTKGGSPVMWQHMFWFYSHPAVYITILPAFGIISEVLPTFARKPIFGYKLIAFSSMAIAIAGLYGLGAPHVHVGPGALLATAVYDSHVRDRRPDRYQDLLVDGNTLRRQDPLHDGNALWDRFRRSLLPSAESPESSSQRSLLISTCTVRTSSSGTSITF